jgi:hypothetical protein
VGGLDVELDREREGRKGEESEDAVDHGGGCGVKKKTKQQMRVEMTTDTTDPLAVSPQAVGPLAG